MPGKKNKASQQITENIDSLLWHYCLKLFCDILLYKFEKMNRNCAWFYSVKQELLSIQLRVRTSKNEHSSKFIIDSFLLLIWIHHFHIWRLSHVRKRKSKVKVEHSLIIPVNCAVQYLWNCLIVNAELTGSKKSRTTALKVIELTLKMTVHSSTCNEHQNS